MRKLIFITLFMVACAASHLAYNDNRLNPNWTPEQYNHDRETCKDYAWGMAPNVIYGSTEKWENYYRQCMEKRGWIVRGKEKETATEAGAQTQKW